MMMVVVGHWDLKIIAWFWRMVDCGGVFPVKMKLL